MSRAHVRAAMLVGSLAAAPARAAPPAVPALAPFTADQLAAALARRAPGQRLPPLEVTYAAGRIEIHLVDRRVAVDLAGQAGEDAARVVALAILDSIDSIPTHARDAAPPARPSPVVATAPPRSPARDHGPTLTLGMVASAGTRPALQVQINGRIVGRARAVLEVGRTTTTDTPDLDLDRYPIRGALAARVPLGPTEFELRAGPIATVERARAAYQSTEVVLGAGAAVALLAPVAASRLGLGVVGGVDAYASARTYVIDGVSVARTDRLAWWAGLAVTMAVRR